MRIGDKVKIEETKQTGKIIEIDDNGEPKKVELDDGTVIEVIDKTITLISAIEKILTVLKSIFSIFKF